MTKKYAAPVYQDSAFHCPICQVYANQIWMDLYSSTGNLIIDEVIKKAICAHCKKFHYWLKKEGKLLHPASVNAETPHPDMPSDCAIDFEEARAVFAISPKSAAALERLCVQKLMIHLGEKGNNINEDIRMLVSKGLPIEIQQALDFCRVIGNNAVHPGEIDVNDNPEVVNAMFSLINFIVEDRIARPKNIAKLYERLPSASLASIEKRDAKI